MWSKIRRMDDKPPTASGNQSRAKNKSMNKWARRALWALGSIAVLWGLSWALVPPILKSQLEKAAGEALGRKVTVGKIDFKPWTLELELQDLSIAAATATSPSPSPSTAVTSPSRPPAGPPAPQALPAPSAAPQLLIKRIYVDAALQSLLRLAPVVDAVAVDGVNLKLAHLGDGKYDIDDILARLNKPSGKPASEPLKFALFNLALTNSAVDFSDKAVGKTHELRDLNLSVPFLSNLDSRRDVKTEPKLAFKLNGSRFDSDAQTTPFAQSHKTDASIRLTGVDLKPYLGYVPASVPVRLLAAVLNADIKVAFEQVSRPSVKLSGVVETQGVKVADLRTQDLLAFESLKVTLDDVRPLEQVVKVSLLELSAPTLEVSRDKAGNINLQLQPLTPNANANTGTTSNTTKKIANYADPTRATATSDSKKEPWKLEIAKVAVRGGAVTWRDDTTAPQARLLLRDVVLDASAIAWPFAQPLQFSGTAALAGAVEASLGASVDVNVKGKVGGRAKASAKASAVAKVPKPDQAAAKGADPAQKSPQTASAALTFTGSATDQAATVNATVKDVPLALAAPYLAQFIDPALGGSVSTEIAVNWKPSDLSLGVKLLTLDNLALLATPPRLGQPGQLGRLSKGGKAPAPLASLKKLEIYDARVDLGPQTVTVGKLTLDQLKAAVERGSDGRWMFERWMKPVPPAQQANSAAPHKSASARTVPKEAKEAKSPPAKPWTVAVADLSLNASAFTYLDQATPKPVSFEVSAIKAQVKAFSTDAKKPFPLSLSARIRAAQGEPGLLDYRGNLGLLPLAAQGKVVATQIPVHAFEPYFGDALNIELLRADVGFKGDVRFVNGAKGPQVKVTGDSVLEEFRANSAVAKLTGSAAPSGNAGGSVGSVGAGAMTI